MGKKTVTSFVLSISVFLSLLTAPLTAVKANTASTFVDIYNPSIVRDFHIEFAPLSGWRPVEGSWNPPEDWEQKSDADKDLYIAQDPVLKPLAIAEAWDKVRFDTTNSVIVKAYFYERFNGVDEDPLTVGVRRKSSRALPSEANPLKIGMKVRFGDFVSGQKWHGVTQLSLENGGDISPLHEGMAWQLHQMAGVSGFYGDGFNPALAAWSTVTVNGIPLGVYTNVEERNKQFLRNRNLWTSGTTWMYEQDDLGIPTLDEGPDPLADGTLVHSQTFKDLCFTPFRPTTGEYAATCSAPSDGTLDDLLNSKIFMTGFLTQAAIDAFTTNDDALMKGKNYNFIDRTGELRRYYPWDLDAVFRTLTKNVYAYATSTNKRVTTYSQTPWQSMVLNHPIYRTRFNETMIALLNGPISATQIDALFARIRPQLEPALAADPYFTFNSTGTAREHLDSLRSWITSRDAEVRRQVQANLPAPRKADSVLPTTSLLSLNPISTTPNSQVQVRATVSDNVEVSRAEMRLADGAPIQMSPVSGSFGTSSLEVLGSLTAPASDGSYSICVRSIDSSDNIGNWSCAQLLVGATKLGTSLAYQGDTEFKANANATFKAKLQYSAGSLSAIAGAQITFIFAGKSYTAITTSDGVAAVTVKAPSKPGDYTLMLSSKSGTEYSEATAIQIIKIIR